VLRLVEPSAGSVRFAGLDVRTTNGAALRALRRRMQGKSCFNFKRPDPDLMAELEALTRAAAELYARHFTLERIDGQLLATPAPSGPSDN
jgi:hypothetical protein